MLNFDKLFLNKIDEIYVPSQITAQNANNVILYDMLIQ